jgi:hypothetical protein
VGAGGQISCEVQREMSILSLYVINKSGGLIFNKASAQEDDLWLSCLHASMHAGSEHAGSEHAELSRVAA